MTRLEKDQIPFKDLCDEAQINYEHLRQLSYSKTMVSNLKKIDTLTTFYATWNDSIDKAIIGKEKVKLYNWLKYKLDLDTLQLK